MSKNGFTLIEILVTTVIIVTLLGFGLAGWGRFRAKTFITAATNRLLTELRLIRSRAISGEKPQDCLTLEGYQVNIEDHRLTVNVCCDGNCQISYQTINLDPKIELQLTGFPLIFWSFSGNADHEAQIKVNYRDWERTITISSSGEIK